MSVRAFLSTIARPFVKKVAIWLVAFVQCSSSFALAVPLMSETSIVVALP